MCIRDRPLTKENIFQIVDLLMKDLQRRLEDKQQMCIRDRGSGWLADFNVAQSDVDQCLQLAGNARQAAEKFQTFFHGHFQNIVNTLSFIFDLQRFTIVPPSLTNVAGDVDVG